MIGIFYPTFYSRYVILFAHSGARSKNRVESDPQENGPMRAMASLFNVTWTSIRAAFTGMTHLPSPKHVRGSKIALLHQRPTSLNADTFCLIFKMRPKAFIKDQGNGPRNCENYKLLVENRIGRKNAQKLVNKRPSGGDTKETGFIPPMKT